jgi:dCMP deaminase
MRPNKTEYYLNIAKAVATRGTCLRRNYGAVIVKDDEIVGTGYTGAPRGEYNCCDRGACDRELLGCKPGEHYELCRSVHAEMNAILSAGRKMCIGATIYIIGMNLKTGVWVSNMPCHLCERVITNAGIHAVVIPGSFGLVGGDRDGNRRTRPSHDSGDN